jgi:hypothetical protein
MKIKDLQLRRDLVLMAYEAGKLTKETARAKCRVLTQAIEKLAEKSKPVQSIGHGVKTP